MPVNVERAELRPGFFISRLARGNWQIADDHSGRNFDDQQTIDDMFAFVDAGVTAFVCGDIYVGVEARIGRFLQQYRARYGGERARDIKVLTTYVPHFLDEERTRRHSKKDCVTIIDRSLQRLGLERLDLVQMHWWNYAIPGNVEMALALKDLQQEGKIDKLAATNYDVPHLREMMDAGVDIVSHTVQYSILDRRPENGMVELCRQRNCQLLCYGALGGGLFSRKWLGIPDPGGPCLENVSLDKYYRIVNDFGGWALFQQLLRVLGDIAEKHTVSIGNVAVRYILEKDQVGTVIIGARDATRLQENLRVFSFSLDASDYREIDRVLRQCTGPRGDCYGIDREENRDALEEVKTTYMDVVDGQLVRKTRPPVVIAEPYGHYLKK